MWEWWIDRGLEIFSFLDLKSIAIDCQNFSVFTWVINTVMVEGGFPTRAALFARAIARSREEAEIQRQADVEQLREVARRDHERYEAEQKQEAANQTLLQIILGRLREMGLHGDTISAAFHLILKHLKKRVWGQLYDTIIRTSRSLRGLDELISRGLVEIVPTAPQLTLDISHLLQVGHLGASTQRHESLTN